MGSVGVPAESADPIVKMGDGDFDGTFLSFNVLGRLGSLLRGVPGAALLLLLPLDLDGTLVDTRTGLGSSVGSAGSAGAVASSVVVLTDKSMLVEELMVMT